VVLAGSGAPATLTAAIGIEIGRKRISLRMLHVWEIKDGRMSRENVWPDGHATVAQLTA